MFPFEETFVFVWEGRRRRMMAWRGRKEIVSAFDGVEKELLAVVYLVWMVEEGFQWLVIRGSRIVFEWR